MISYCCTIHTLVLSYELLILRILLQHPGNKNMIQGLTIDPMILYKYSYILSVCRRYIFFRMFSNFQIFEKYDPNLNQNRARPKTQHREISRQRTSFERAKHDDSAQSILHLQCSDDAWCRELYYLSLESEYIHVRPSSPNVIVSCCWKLLNPETRAVCSLKRLPLPLPLEDSVPRSTPPRAENSPRRLISTEVSKKCCWTNPLWCTCQRYTTQAPSLGKKQKPSLGFYRLHVATIKRGA